ncbi:hypothetical protein MLD38_031555 [Melastoma candidum]|nr:hypothetical protein MLD38_031555 [Melastoma candidum]
METHPTSSSSSSLIATITRAVRLPSTSPAFSFILFHLLFIPFSILLLLHSLLVSPLLHRVEDAYEVSSVDPHDLQSLATRESVVFISLSAVSFLGMIIVVHGSDLLLAGVNDWVRVRDLLLSRVRSRSSWRVPVFAWVSVSGSTVAWVVATLLMVVLVNDVNIWWSSLVLVLAAVGYLWLAAIGNLVLVVAVLEDGIGDLKAAVTRSWNLMRGLWKDGVRLMLVLETMSAPIYVMFSVTTMDDDDILGLVARFGFGYVAMLLFCIARFFAYVVFAVFYHECRKSNGEELETELAHSPCYSYNAVPNDVVVEDVVTDLDSSVA